MVCFGLFCFLTLYGCILANSVIDLKTCFISVIRLLSSLETEVLRLLLNSGQLSFVAKAGGLVLLPSDKNLIVEKNQPAIKSLSEFCFCFDGL